MNIVRRLQDDDDVSLFDCGVDEAELNERLNEYLIVRAKKLQKKDASKTWVTTEGNRVTGYYTGVFTGIPNKEAPRKIKQLTFPHAVPAYLVARLAVDKEFQHQVCIPLKTAGHSGAIRPPAKQVFMG